MHKCNTSCTHENTPVFSADARKTKKSALERIVSVTRGCYTHTPHEYITVAEMLRRFKEGDHRPPVENVRRLIKKASETGDAGDIARSRAAKDRLTSYVPTGAFEYVNTEPGQCKEHTGILIFECDPKDGFDARAARQTLIEDPHTLAVFTSAGGAGVKALIHVEQPPDTSNASHKKAFKACWDRFEIAGRDETGSDISRFTFASYDPDLYINPDAIPLPVCYEEKPLPPPPPPPALTHSDTDQVREVLRHIPPRPDYNTWIRIIAGVLEKTGDIYTAEALLKEWSPEEREGEYLRKLKSPLARITFGTVIHIAKGCGYEPPRLDIVPPAHMVEHMCKSPESLQSLQSLQSLPVSKETLPETLSAKMDTGGPVPYQEFPLEMLPTEVQDYVRACSTAMSIDPGMMGLLSLGALASAIGRTREAQVYDGWEMPAIVWPLIITGSGNKKSQALKKILGPIYEQENRAEEKYREEFDHYEYLLMQRNGMTKGEMEETPAPSKPKRTSYYTTDPTVEGVIRVLADNTRGIGAFSDELSSLFGSMNRYARGNADAGFWTRFYDAGPAIKVDRASKDPITLKAPSVSIVGAIQPSMLRQSINSNEVGIGLLQRFMTFMPKEYPRVLSFKGIDRDVRARYHDLFSRLFAIPVENEPRTMPLSSHAKDIYKGFYNNNARLMYETRDEVLRSMMSKVEAMAVRIALLIQVSMDPEAEEIGADAMRRGVTLASWVRHSNARTYQTMGYGTPEDDDSTTAAYLPDEEFGWQAVREIFGLQHKGSTYKKMGRLIQKGLIRQTGRGRYCVVPEAVTPPANYRHIATAIDIPDLVTSGDGKAYNDGAAVEEPPVIVEPHTLVAEVSLSAVTPVAERIAEVREGDFAHIKGETGRWVVDEVLRGRRCALIPMSMAGTHRPPEAPAPEHPRLFDDSTGHDHAPDERNKKRKASPPPTPERRIVHMDYVEIIPRQGR